MATVHVEPIVLFEAVAFDSRDACLHLWNRRFFSSGGVFFLSFFFLSSCFFPFELFVFFLAVFFFYFPSCFLSTWRRGMVRATTQSTGSAESKKQHTYSPRHAQHKANHTYSPRHAEPPKANTPTPQGMLQEIPTWLVAALTSI